MLRITLFVLPFVATLAIWRAREGCQGREGRWFFSSVDTSDSGIRGVPWTAYNSSDAAIEVPHWISWMLDAEEMYARARRGLVDMGVARRLSEFVSATYCSPENIAAWNCSRCSDDLDLVTLTWDPEWDLVGVVGWSKALDGIVISFRGTDSHSYYNWVENMRTWRTDLSLSYEGMPHDALVHGGFFYSYNNSSLARDVAGAVRGIMAKRAERGEGGGGGAGWDGPADGTFGPVRRYDVDRVSIRGNNDAGNVRVRGRKHGMPSGVLWAGSQAESGGTTETRIPSDHRMVSPTVFVSGHSLGGALATFCALEMKLVEKIEDVRVVTFGSPRVGNAVFAEWFKATVPQHVRFTHNRDMIPSLPPVYMGFSHIPQEVWLVDVVPSRTLVGICDDWGEDERCHLGACNVFGVDSICVSLADHLGYLSPMYQPRPNGC